MICAKLMSVNNENILSVRNLSHKYSTQYAVKDVSLELSNNEIVGLLGSNGAGKSTMMNIICGVLRQTEGEVYIKGKNIITDNLEAKRNIGFLPQKPPLQPDLSVEEYLIHTAILRDVTHSEISSSVSRVLKYCQIEHFRRRLIKNLSGGYQQRVGIAQAIIHNPDFIVLDEPTNGLDPNQILEIRELIKDISHNRLVLLSTHILQEVQAMCDRIIMIEHGEFVFSGSRDDFSNAVVSNSIFVTFKNPPSAKELCLLPLVKDADFLEQGVYKCTILGDEFCAQQQIIENSVTKNWQLVEIYKEKIHPDEIFKHFSKTMKQ